MKRVVGRWLVLAAVVLLGLFPVSAFAAAPVLPPASQGWLSYYNFWRQSAGLNTVTEDPVRSTGDQHHAHYLILNQVFTHQEVASNPGYTTDGAYEGLHSDITGEYGRTLDPYSALAGLMGAPFHAMQLLTPTTTQAGFGMDNSGPNYPGLTAAAAIDPVSDLGGSATFPVLFPGNGVTVPIAAYSGGESPDPEQSCGPSVVRGGTESAPYNGLPIIFQAGGGTAIGVTAFSVTPVGGFPLDVCEIDSHKVVDSSGTAASILASQGAVILMPHDPLSPGQTYIASITNNGTTTTWSFGIGRQQASANAIDFGDVRVGTSSTKTLTVTNNGTNQYLQVSSVALQGTDAGQYSIPVNGNGCVQVVLAPQTSCTAQVTFAPTSMGPKNSVSVAVQSDDPVHGTLPVALTGVGRLPIATFTPSPLDAGVVATNDTTHPESVHLQNTGNADLVISQTGLTGDTAWAATTSMPSCGSPPITLAAGSSCDFHFNFNPTVDGQHVATLTITDNTPIGSHSVSLSGVSHPKGRFCPPAGATPARAAAIVDKTQYTLPNSDGATWQDIDAASLDDYCKPSANQTVLLTANADLFTANAGYNQDIGIFASDNGGVDQLLAWKESGGFAGTFSPNAAYVQARYSMTSGHNYVFKLKWKTNRNAPGATIYAGAGGGPQFSNTSLVAETFPSGVVPNLAVSTSQYTLSNSDGINWQPIDAGNLSTTLNPGANATAVLGANVDLFTANTGYNQDVGIFVSDNGGPDALVAWKESGGFAGTFSPNAAFVKATHPMTAGHSYVFKLKWKTNKNAPGTTIFAGAGGGPYSPTSLVAETIPAGANPYHAVSTSQYTLSDSNGLSWQPLDAALNLTVVPGANTNYIVGANADLFTGNSGYNQDIGIFVSDNGGTDQLVAWKESGGFAGIYSPNAAFVQGSCTVQGCTMSAGHSYVFKIKWKTNRDAPGSTIFAGAGGPASFSPTRLTVELTS